MKFVESKKPRGADTREKVSGGHTYSFCSGMQAVLRRAYIGATALCPARVRVLIWSISKRLGDVHAIQPAPHLMRLTSDKWDEQASRKNETVSMKTTTHHLIAEVPRRNELTIGRDLVDVWSHYSTLNQDGEVVDRGRFKTTPRRSRSG
jgi:hypothetical protein